MDGCLSFLLYNYNNLFYVENMKLLLVEDDESLTECLSYLLRIECNQEAFSASSIKSALTSISKVEFDLVVLDYKLADGFAEPVIEFIRDNCPNTKIMMITAYPITCTIFKHMKPDWLFKKPFDDVEVQKMVEIICELKRKKIIDAV